MAVVRRASLTGLVIVLMLVVMAGPAAAANPCTIPTQNGWCVTSPSVPARGGQILLTVFSGLGWSVTCQAYDAVSGDQVGPPVTAYAGTARDRVISGLTRSYYASCWGSQFGGGRVSN
jgi:hypothetical protein